jgi:UDP-N-acetyl-D-glucosamine dehydrogenase
MTKLCENTFRAVNIALANEFADISRALDLDIVEVITAAGSKPYGFMPFYPGPGVGGHCIPCDPHYLLWQLRSHRMRAPLVEQAMAAIVERPGRVVERAREVLADVGRGVRGSTILLVGVTYKPGVEDVRESPALEIFTRLRSAGAQVCYWDALVPTLALPDGSRLSSVHDPCEVDADLVLVHTRHPRVDHAWVAEFPCVLDATYRLEEVPHRARI